MAMSVSNYWMDYDEIWYRFRYINVPLRMICNAFDDPVIFPLNAICYLPNFKDTGL